MQLKFLNHKNVRLFFKCSLDENVLFKISNMKFGHFTMGQDVYKITPKCTDFLQNGQTLFLTLTWPIKLCSNEKCTF